MSRRSSCAICNTPKRPEDPHQIYVNFSVSGMELMAEVAEGLGQIDESSPAVSVKKAASKISAVAPAVRPEQVQTRLLEVAEGLEQRIYPIFSRVDEMSKEIIALKEKISHLEHKNRRLKTELRDVEALQLELVTSEHEVAELRTACDAQRTELARALMKVRNQEVKYNKRSAELVAAQQVIEEKDKQLHLANKKLRALGKQSLRKQQPPRPPSYVGDDSLVVLDAPSGSRRSA
ncbi:hypothetical protein EYR40_001510 [Pleurotus pulmonarius]|nr:hypothetical protein EYR38_004753 [Pleurotus pulmonarius]KAF4609157.1 hypothetical protein EYR40_001510 [Pleurotus pulmonarius]